MSDQDDPEEDMTAQIHLRIHDEAHRRIRQIARENYTTPSQWARNALYRAAGLSRGNRRRK